MGGASNEAKSLSRKPFFAPLRPGWTSIPKDQPGALTGLAADQARHGTAARACRADRDQGRTATVGPGARLRRTQRLPCLVRETQPDVLVPHRLSARGHVSLIHVTMTSSSRSAARRTDACTGKPIRAECARFAPDGRPQPRRRHARPEPLKWSQGLGGRPSWARGKATADQAPRQRTYREETGQLRRWPRRGSACERSATSDTARRPPRSARRPAVRWGRACAGPADPPWSRSGHPSTPSRAVGSARCG